jgi:hypothetical protein
MIAGKELGAGVDAAVVAGGRFFDAIAVVDLDLVEPHELDAGVGALGDEEIEFDLDIGEEFAADEVSGSARGIVEDDALALGGRDEVAFVVGLEGGVGDLGPGARGGFPGGKADLGANQNAPLLPGVGAGVKGAREECGEEGGPEHKGPASGHDFLPASS